MLMKMALEIETEPNDNSPGDNFDDAAERFDKLTGIVPESIALQLPSSGRLSQVPVSRPSGLPPRKQKNSV
jgi:hypothetical protein